MIFKHESWGDKKHYSVAHNGVGGYTIREIVNGAQKTELRISRDEKIAFEKKLKDGGWYEQLRR